MIIDIHCHYALSRREAGEAAGRFSFERQPGPDGRLWDACLAPRTARWLSWRGLQWLAGIDWRLGPGEALDAAYERVFAEHLLSDGPIERSVLLAFDWYHDDEGRVPPPPQRAGQFGSDMYVSNSFVAQLCRRHPERLLFGASVHPYRRDALGCIDEVFAAGAVLLKWIPLHQNIDVADERTLAVLRHCAQIGLPLLVHYNEEFTLSTQHVRYQPPGGLLDVLRRLRRAGCMPTTIVAHAATPVWPLGDVASYRTFLEALAGEFRDAPLYADISALTVVGKVGFARELARRVDLHHKLLFGSDFPIPIAMWRLRRDLGREYQRIAAIRSWPNRMLDIFRTIGFSEVVFYRAAEVLANARASADALAGGGRPL